MLELVVSLMLFAQAPEPARVSGFVRDQAGRPLAAARVERIGGAESVETDGEGHFSLVVPQGPITLRASRARSSGFAEGAPVLRELVVSGPVAGLELVLQEVVRLDESVVVEAVRAADWVPVTTEDLSKADLIRLDRGQELPFLLARSPSVTQYSDNGSESGYAYLYLRGIPQTRLNLTLDGVPLTDAEDNAFYSVNFGALAGALESVQVQRGAATASFGGASFGGSVSLAGLRPEERAGARVLAGLGSLGAARAAAEGHSGRFGPGLAAFTRVAYQETDGYRDHSGVQQRSLALGLTRQGARSFFKLFGLAGREQQQLAFLAVDEETLGTSPRENPLSPDERDRFAQQVFRRTSPTPSATAHISPGRSIRTPPPAGTASTPTPNAPPSTNTPSIGARWAGSSPWPIGGAASTSPRARRPRASPAPTPGRPWRWVPTTRTTGTRTSGAPLPRPGSRRAAPPPGPKRR